MMDDLNSLYDGEMMMVLGFCTLQVEGWDALYCNNRQSSIIISKSLSASTSNGHIIKLIGDESWGCLDLGSDQSAGMRE